MGPATAPERRPTKKDGKPPPAQKEVSKVDEMQKTIDSQAAEILTLREVLATIGNGEGDLREAKLLQLFKKNKVLNVQLECERARNRNMRKTVVIVEEELKRREKGEVREDKNVKKGIQFWVDKYHMTNTKLMEAQSKIGTLDAKIVKLMYVLRREVGDHIPIDKVIEEGSGWVGRSEKISLLNDKVAELKGLVHEMMPTANPPGYLTALHDDRRTVEIVHRNRLEAMDKDRRHEYEKLAHDLVRVTKSWGEQRDKLIGINARRNILEKEINKAKDTIAVLLSKSKNDDLLINALSAELAGARQAAGPPYPKPGGPTQMEDAARCHKLAAQYHDLKNQCHEQELRIKCQGEIINSFQATLDPPGGVEDWVTTNVLKSSYKSDPRLITVDNF